MHTHTHTHRECISKQSGKMYSLPSCNCYSSNTLCTNTVHTCELSECEMNRILAISVDMLANCHFLFLFFFLFMYTQTHTHTQRHTWTHTCKHIHTHTHTHKHTHTHTPRKNRKTECKNIENKTIKKYYAANNYATTMIKLKRNNLYQTNKQTNTMSITRKRESVQTCYMTPRRSK